MALLAGRVRGQTVRGLVIGLIYPHSPPSVIFISSTSAIAAGLLRCLWSRRWCLWCLCPIVTLNLSPFPPVTHLNEAQKTVDTFYVCCYLIHCCFMEGFFSCLAPPTSLIYDLISDLWLRQTQLLIWQRSYAPCGCYTGGILTELSLKISFGLSSALLLSVSCEHIRGGNPSAWEGSGGVCMLRGHFRGSPVQM